MIKACKLDKNKYVQGKVCITTAFNSFLYIKNEAEFPVIESSKTMMVAITT